MTVSRLLALAVLATTACPMVAGAAELPLRKAGLWEMKMAAQGPMPAMTMQQCTDETTDRLMSAAASPVANETCSKNEITKTSDGYATDATCTIAGKTSTTHSEISGDFDQAYTVKVTLQTGASRGETMTIEAKWVGACKAEQKPGDVMMPGGMKINVNDLNAARSRLK